MSNQIPERVLLEGFHAVKHALRFAPELVHDILAANDDWRELAEHLAPDVLPELERRVRPVASAEVLKWSRAVHPTGLLGLAKRPEYAIDPVRHAGRTSPLVLLDDPRRPGNVGAVIRVVAAAGGGGVLATGSLDVWHAAVVRAAAGLHFALPVVGRMEADDVPGPLIGFEADGRDIREVNVPSGAILVFGTEREGLSPAIRQRCDAVASLPMRPGVSSLNLATSVAAALYYLRLSGRF
jgi:RNA methyltransferase, TrmH family